MNGAHSAPDDSPLAEPASTPSTSEHSLLTAGLRDLLADVDGLHRAVAADAWGESSALDEVVARADSRLAHTTSDSLLGDVAMTGVSPRWRARAARRIADTQHSGDDDTTPSNPVADALLAVELVRLAVADAAVEIGHAQRSAPGAVAHSRAAVLPLILAALRRLRLRTVAEIGRVFTRRPRAVLSRLVITLAISLSLVVFYNIAGWASYDETGTLTLYLFAAVVGSVVCTNALCFEAARVRAELAAGDRLWSILVAKNLAMGALVSAAAAPVITYLALTADLDVAAMVDQFVVMVFIWLGVGNVLSVVFPLRHEPVSARLRDGTWRAYLLSFGISYGIGLTVNLMIYWRLWARQAAAEKLTAAPLPLLLLVLASAIVSWLLLTVLAVSVAREPVVRAILSRELVTYPGKTK